MTKRKLILHSAGFAVLVILYILGISALLINGDNLFGNQMPIFFAPVLTLLLLVISVVVMAVLIFGRPVLMYLDNKKKEAVQFLLGTIAWLIGLAVAFFVILAVVNYLIV